MQEEDLMLYFSCVGPFRSSTRVHGALFLHTSGAHFNHSISWCYCCRGYAATSPLWHFPHRTACILRMFLYLCRRVNAACRL